jgi:hypothetical protein
MSIRSERPDASSQASVPWQRELLFDFAVTEIHLGLAFVSAARAAYDHGQVLLGDDARTRAENVIARARVLSNKLSRKGTDRLSPYLDRLQNSLDGLVK